MTLTELYEIAAKENINIHKVNLKKLNGLYLDKNIFLNSNIKNEFTEKIVLAEELGHHFSGVLPSLPFSTDYYNKLIRSKNEFRAKKWLIQEMIPLSTLKSYLRKNMNQYEIAEEFGISTSLLEEAYHLYGENLQNLSDESY